jgi:hypothetical protein
MTMEDKRCCGSGVCIINAEGICWCGQKWDGDKLLKPESSETKLTTSVSPKAPKKIK